jgi:hypothetical protein
MYSYCQGVTVLVLLAMKPTAVWFTELSALKDSLIRVLFESFVLLEFVVLFWLLLSVTTVVTTVLVLTELFELSLNESRLLNELRYSVVVVLVVLIVVLFSVWF